MATKQIAFTAPIVDAVPRNLANIALAASAGFNPRAVDYLQFGNVFCNRRFADLHFYKLVEGQSLDDAADHCGELICSSIPPAPMALTFSTAYCISENRAT